MRFCLAVLLGVCGVSAVSLASEAKITYTTEQLLDTTGQRLAELDKGLKTGDRIRGIMHLSKLGRDFVLVAEGRSIKNLIIILDDASVESIKSQATSPSDRLSAFDPAEYIVVVKENDPSDSRLYVRGSVTEVVSLTSEFVR